MSRRRTTLVLSLAGIFSVAVATSAYAQATRTWVSGVGDDANPCSRTAPCKTFAGAISKTMAGGEINALDPGGYGAVTITKSITLDATGTLGSILASGVNGIIINGAGAVVTIRGLTINGAGTTPGTNGIRILNASKVFVEQSVIFGFLTNPGNGIRDERIGGGSLFLTDVIIRNNLNGVLINPLSGSGPGVKVLLDNCRLEGNNINGLGFASGPIVTVKDSVAAGNGGAGFYVEGGPLASQLNLERSVSTNNGEGVTAAAGGTARISQTEVTNNGTGLKTTGTGVISSYGTNSIAGNAAGNGPPNGPSIPLQ